MIEVEFGRQRVTLELHGERLLTAHRGPTRLTDPVAALRQALVQPFEFPPLRRALTPDDHLAIVIDVRHPGLSELLIALLEDLVAAGIAPEAVSLLGAEPGISNDWIDDLPEHLEEAQVEEHDASDRKRLAYLATTRGGRRLYLNRTLVEADQAIVLTTRGYDLQGGYVGAERALYPALGDLAEATTDDTNEVAWLLGQPFYVQLIPAAGDGLAAVVAGASQAAREAERQLDAGWRVAVPRRADCVLVSLSGDPSRHTFADLATAVTQASRAVTPGGRVIVVSEALPQLGKAEEMILHADEPQSAVAKLRKANQAGSQFALLWSHAVAHARVSLLSRLSHDLVEDLFATPLEEPAQIQRLLNASQECIFLQDGHRVNVVLS